MKINKDSHLQKSFIIQITTKLLFIHQYSDDSLDTGFCCGYNHLDGNMLYSRQKVPYYHVSVSILKNYT